MLPLPAVSRRSGAVARPGWQFECWAPIWAPNVGGLSPEASAFAISLSLSHEAPPPHGLPSGHPDQFPHPHPQPGRQLLPAVSLRHHSPWALVEFRLIAILGEGRGSRLLYRFLMDWWEANRARKELCLACIQLVQPRPSYILQLSVFKWREGVDT